VHKKCNKHKNYVLGDKLVTLRNRIKDKQTQGEIAKAIEVSLTTFNNWETATTKPNAHNLKKLIAVYLCKEAFTKGKELEEAKQLWAESEVRASFDEEWFNQLLLEQLEQADCAETMVTQTEPDLPAQTVFTIEEKQLEVSPCEPPPNTPNVSILQQSATIEPECDVLAGQDQVGGLFIEVRQDALVQGDWQRRQLLEMTSSTIRDLRRQMLRHAVSIRLKLHELPSAVDTPSHDYVQEGIESERQPVPSILDMYDKTAGALLILGAAGSGKTFLLLELADELINRAKQDENHPIPFILNLSSWALGRSRLPLKQWIINELSDKYKITSEISKALIANNQLLPLLDGLDETAYAHRAACIDAINSFHHDHSLLPIVVCSRIDEYLLQERKLSLRGAVEVQPLVMEQIEWYLTDMNDEEGYVENVCMAIHEDAKLQELVSTPLTLSILTTLAYDQQLVEKLLRETPERRRQYVLTRYIRRMLSRRRAKTYYEPQQTLYWLSWLAQQMARRNQSEFYLERMQFDWLPNSWLHWLLPIIGVGIIYGLFVGTIRGINYAFLQGVDQHGRCFGPMRGLIDGILIGTGCTLIFILLNSLIFWGLTKQKTREDVAENSSITRKNWCILLKKRLIYGIANGLLIGIIIGLLVDLPAGVYNGLFYSVGFAGLGKLDLEIRPAGKISWSWDAVRHNCVKCVGVGILLGLAYGLLTELYWQLTQLSSLPCLQKFLACLLVGFITGLILGLFIVIACGMSHEALSKQIRPNQGIWNSMYNCTLLGGSSCLLFGIFFGAIYGVLIHQIFHLFGVYSGYSHYFPQGTGLVIGLVDGSAIGAFFWLRNGGTACTLHTILRLLLWLEGYIPWNYPRFLNYAAERILLYKVGGYYTFIHGLLQEHFATLGDRDHK
jgi:DNA-binding XRE family transcriptional regulator/Cdc6-like AAA superfamily ATPase